MAGPSPRALSFALLLALGLALACLAPPALADPCDAQERKCKAKVARLGNLKANTRTLTHTLTNTHTH